VWPGVNLRDAERVRQLDGIRRVLSELVDVDYDTTPATGSKALRTGQVREVVPSTSSVFFICSAPSFLAQLPVSLSIVLWLGMLPAVHLSSPCGAITGGETTLSLRESITNAEWGSDIPVSTPGYSGNMTWTVLTVTPVDSACVLSPSMFSITSYSGYGGDRGGDWRVCRGLGEGAGDSRSSARVP